MPPKKHPRQHKKKKSSGVQKSHILQGVGKYRTKGSSRRLKGHGGYAEDIGQGIGSWLGKKAGGLFSSVFGVGKYNVNQNTLLSASPNDPPIVSNTASATRIQHREYIGDISGSTGFVIQTYNINPGLSQTFPWLCSVASAFEQYKMHGLLFEFKSTSADALNSTNTALGTVIMATEYNPLHGAFTAKRDMENYVYSTSNAPSISALHPIECARGTNVLDELFVRNVPLPSADIRFSDMGLFQLATVGMQAAAVIGELWVTYDIELIKPKLPDAYTSTGPAHYVYNPVGPIIPSPAPIAPVITNLFGTPGLFKVGLLGTGVTPVTLNTNMITFNSTGRFLVALGVWYTAPLTAATPTVTYGTGAAAAAIQLSTGAFNYYPLGGTTNMSNMMLFNTVDVSNVTGGTVTFGGITSGTISYLDLWIFPLPTGFSLYDEPELAKIYTMIDRLQKKCHFDDSDDEKYLSTSPQLIRQDADEARLSQSTVDLVQILKDRVWPQAIEKNVTVR